MKLMSCNLECIKTSLARFYVTRSACKQVLYGYFSTKPEAYIRIIKSANEVVESSVFFRDSLQLMNPCFFPRFHFSSQLCRRRWRVTKLAQLISLCFVTKRL